MAAMEALGPEGCGMPKSSPTRKALMMSFKPSAFCMPRMASISCSFCSAVVSAFKRNITICRTAIAAPK
eukprot:CAMPEP_0176081162 /NCGR_PEP_ID=MMETSP0120_2-20121206/40599_1 /TAXON_ID=160619 /ORGANISM="Kryptoperidinium foliaceum, Strain CCMP 1326" /LENGTH=68 /DNA_ID=CAMNT_0017414931 /DNA_START=132 /DNA_END=338 /DNA_ORIENTATION=-